MAYQTKNQGEISILNKPIIPSEIEAKIKNLPTKEYFFQHRILSDIQKRINTDAPPIVLQNTN